MKVKVHCCEKFFTYKSSTRRDTILIDEFIWNSDISQGTCVCKSVPNMGVVLILNSFDAAIGGFGNKFLELTLLSDKSTIMTRKDYINLINISSTKKILTWSEIEQYLIN